MHGAGPDSRPPAEWIARISFAVPEGSRADGPSIAAGVLIGERLVLTCRHVLTDHAPAIRLEDHREMTLGEGEENLLKVTFPRSQDDPVREYRVESVRCDAEQYDVALLRLREGPPDVEPAPVQCAPPARLLGRTWWAYGFPGGYRHGRDASGTIGGQTTLGYVRLARRSDPEGVGRGFSGTGLWCPEEQAVVGIVTDASSDGDGEAITCHRIARCFEDIGLERPPGWAWSLAGDPEAALHWEPRAGGMENFSVRGPLFQGRTAVLTRIVEWLDAPASRHEALVVTGPPGAGKSAVLARIVTTAADPEVAGAAEVRASPGSVACAVHAKEKTALAVAREIARAARSTRPDDLEAFEPLLREALSRGAGTPFNAVIDALDEALDPTEARKIIKWIVLPMVEGCADVGARVVIGTQPYDRDGDLLRPFGRAQVKLDLHENEFFELRDLEDYALAILRLAGVARADNPYTDDMVARPVAKHIAKISDRNFLIARIIAGDRGLHDRRPADPGELGYPEDVKDALDDYLGRVRALDGLPEPRAVLGALAFAEEPGFPLSLWAAVIEVLTGTSPALAGLAEFAGSSAANFLIGSPGAAEPGSGERSFKLFHPALQSALKDAFPDLKGTRAAVAHRLLAEGRKAGWPAAPPYLLHALPAHLRGVGEIDELLTDDDYLLHADLFKLVAAADRARTERGRLRARLLRLTGQAVPGGPADRAARFGVTEALDGLGDAYRTSGLRVPYRARWAAATPRSERMIFEGHTRPIRSVCAFPAGRGVHHLASGDDTGTVRIWDLRRGDGHRVLRGHEAAVWASCGFTSAREARLATGDRAGVLRLWDPSTGASVGQWRGQGEWIRTVCAFPAGGGADRLAIGTDEGTVWIHDPAGGGSRRLPAVHEGAVRSICPLPSPDGGVHLVTAGADGVVRIWDPRTARPVREFGNGPEQILSACVLTDGGRSYVVTAGADGVVRIWDPRTRLPGPWWGGRSGQVLSVSGLTDGGRSYVVIGGEDGVVRVWDPWGNGQERRFHGHENWVWSVCSLPLDGRSYAVSGGDDTVVRVWEAEARHARRPPEGPVERIRSVCAYPARDGRTHVAGGGDDGVHVWDPADGENPHRRSFHDQAGRVRSVAAVTVGGRTLLVSGEDNGSVRFRDVEAGDWHPLAGGLGPVRSLCAFGSRGTAYAAIGSDRGQLHLWELRESGLPRQFAGRGDRVRSLSALETAAGTVLASADDRGVSFWDLSGGERYERIRADDVGAVRLLTVGGRLLLAGGGADGTVRVWHPPTGERLWEFAEHTQSVTAVCAFSGNGGAYLATGGEDRTVRIWNPVDGRVLRVIPVHHPVEAVTEADGLLVVGLSAGLIVIELDVAALRDDPGGSR